MKRKLISYDVFESILSESLSSAESELVGAVDVLDKVLVDDLELLSYGAEDVMYESSDGYFVHANYEIKEGNIHFSNIEQIVIDEESEKVNAKSTLTELLDAVLESKTEVAEQKFAEYMSLPMTRRTLTEGRKQLTGAHRGQRQQRVTARKDKSGKIKVSFTSGRGKRSPLRGKKQSKSLVNKRVWAKKRASRSRTSGEEARLDRARSVAKRAHGFGMKKMVKEWSNLCENVFDFLSYKDLGPTIGQAVIEQDDKGNVVSVAVPTQSNRNEQQLLSFDWKTLKTDVDVLRSNAQMLSEDGNFCKAVAELKRHNALSDFDGLEEALENIVGKWPSVLYLTQTELAETIKNSLEVVNASNFDDDTCEFMAEGILRAAHNAYVDRVSRIVRLSGSEVKEESEDRYADFKAVVDNFYPTLDENNQREMQIFVDLYEALRAIHDNSDDAEVRTETAIHLDELAAIIQQEEQPSLEVAEAAALWLSDIVETNLDSSEWNPTNSVHTSTTGDHPEMAKKARQSYSPSSDASGDWGDEAPVSDGKGYKNGLAKQMRSNSWGNIGGNDTYPSLNNPYVPKPFGDYTMKGEKGVDKEGDATGQWSSKDTWPALQNPHVPNGETAQSYKMNKGKEQDLVVDK